jgi:hypothetical protein
MAFALVVTVPITDAVETVAVEALKAAVDQPNHFGPGNLAESLVGKIECKKLDNPEGGSELLVAVNLSDEATSADLDEATIKTTIESYINGQV